jgi:hypothetical protein
MTDTLAKALSLINSKSTDTIALEALVKVMERVLTEGGYEGSGVGESGLEEAGIGSNEPIYKHPLEDYTVSQKDIGSVVTVWDRYSHNSEVTILKDVVLYNNLPFQTENSSYTYAAPYRGPIKLHFKPYHATPDSKDPEDLLDGDPEFIALLWDNGMVNVKYTWSIADSSFWKFDPTEHIVGYCPLFFVNPILDSSEDTEEKV